MRLRTKPSGAEVCDNVDFFSREKVRPQTTVGKRVNSEIPAQSVRTSNTENASLLSLARFLERPLIISRVEGTGIAAARLHLIRRTHPHSSSRTEPFIQSVISSRRPPAPTDRPTRRGRSSRQCSAAANPTATATTTGTSATNNEYLPMRVVQFGIGSPRTVSSALLCSAQSVTSFKISISSGWLGLI